MLAALKFLDGLFACPKAQPTAAAASVVVLNPLPASPLGQLDAALQAVAPGLTQAERSAWMPALNAALSKAGIATARCIAAFLGQCATESGGFQMLEENLNYSAERLCQVWPTRFPNAVIAASCAMQPEKLANLVYADRMGNGDAASGDGWRFRGRGLLQLTGRAAYAQFAAAMAMTVDQAADHAATRQGSVDSAAWFWSANGLNQLAQGWAIDEVSKKINGGTEGSADRTRLCEAALHALGAK